MDCTYISPKDHSVLYTALVNTCQHQPILVAEATMQGPTCLSGAIASYTHSNTNEKATCSKSGFSMLHKAIGTIGARN